MNTDSYLVLDLCCHIYIEWFFPAVDMLQESCKDYRPLSYKRWCSASPLNSEMLGGQSAVHEPCCFSHDSWDEPEEAQCVFHLVPRPPDPSKLLHIVAHTHACRLISQGQICVSVCVTSIKRDKWPEHPLLFDAHMFHPKQKHILRHARHSDH